MNSITSWRFRATNWWCSGSKFFLKNSTKPDAFVSLGIRPATFQVRTNILYLMKLSCVMSLVSYIFVDIRFLKLDTCLLIMFKVPFFLNAGLGGVSVLDWSSTFFSKKDILLWMLLLLGLPSTIALDLKTLRFFCCP